MLIQLACAGLIVVGDSSSVIVFSDQLYAKQVEFKATTEPRVYEDDTQMRLTIAHDRRRIWINPDVDDRPGRGDDYPCRKFKPPLR